VTFGGKREERVQKSPICRQPYPTTAVRAAERANDDPADRARPSAVARDQHSTIAEALAVTPGQAARREAGAVAVEFALLLPLLMLFLFGFIQYGYGLFQLQTFNSTVSDSARSLATGITGCSAFDSTLNTLVSGNGLDPAAISDVQVAWVNADGSPLPQRTRSSRSATRRSRSAFRSSRSRTSSPAPGSSPSRTSRTPR
jgi:Flp pilus assembly protein TadG